MLTCFVFLLVLFHLRRKVEDRRIDTKQNFVKIFVTSDALVSVVLIHQCLVREDLRKIVRCSEDCIPTIQPVLYNLRLVSVTP